MPQGRRFRWAAKLITAAAATLATLLVLEAVVRRLPGSEPPLSDALPPPGPHAPRFTETPLPAKAPGEFRIVALGDSFTYGWRLRAEDAWPYRLERRLAALLPDRRVTVVNAGRGAWISAEEARFLRKVADQLQPDLVVLGYCLNDPEPNTRGRRQEQMAPTHRRAPEGAAAWWHRHSASFRLCWERIEDRRMRHATIAYYRKLFEPGPWARSLRQILAMRAAAAERGAQLAVTVWPVFDFPRLDDGYPYREIHELVRQSCEEKGLPSLDLLPAFAGMDGGRLAVEPGVDGHPSSIATRVAADHIARFLIDRDLVPAAPVPMAAR